MRFLFRIVFILFFIVISLILLDIVLKPVFNSPNVIITYGLNPFDISTEKPILWSYIKKIYIISYVFSTIIISNSFFQKFIFQKLDFKKRNKNSNIISENELNLFIGNNSENNEKIFIPEKGLFQNILITGTIGTGKTSSAMYPFTEQLIKYDKQKIGMLILDVKGNFYKKVSEICAKYEREDDLLILELGGNIRYNPLHKPNLKPIVLANRLKTVLTLFSQNNSDSYWLDKAEEVISECIKLCRLYNNGYVTFLEIHKLINFPNYYKEKIDFLRTIFQSGKLSQNDTYDLLSSLEFFETEFKLLDQRVLSIIKSEITRITSPFISELTILNTFSPEESNLNFKGFSEIINNGKILVLNMKIAEYKNLSKIIAAYLKLDFQSEVLSSISSNTNITAFISDEFHEYVTSTDSDFFAQSREAKCVNIVATQSYTSLLNTLKDQNLVKSITQNLINKLWFRTDDIFTIEETQKQIGKEEKIKKSKSISENAKETNFDYFSNTLKSTDSNISESISTYTQNDFIYDTSFFSQKLETFSCLGFLSTGNKILAPTKINMIPYFKNNFNSKKNSFI